jgi:hypothetical protein
VFPLFLVLFLAGVALWFVTLWRYGMFGSGKAADPPPAIELTLTRSSVSSKTTSPES